MANRGVYGESQRMEVGKGEASTGTAGHAPLPQGLHSATCFMANQAAVVTPVTRQWASLHCEVTQRPQLVSF